MGDVRTALVARVAAQAAPIFTANGWTWRRDDGYRIPTTEDIEATLNELLDHMDKRHSGCVSSGRFSVSRDDEDGEVTISLGWSAIIPTPSQGEEENRG